MGRDQVTTTAATRPAKLDATLDTAKFGNKDIHLDYTLHGPVLGIGFRF